MEQLAFSTCSVTSVPCRSVSIIKAFNLARRRKVCSERKKPTLTESLALWHADLRQDVDRQQSLRLFFGSLRPRGGESTPEVIDKDADGFRSHEPGRQKYHRGATAPRAADIVATATATYSLRVICRRRSQLAAERGHDQKLDEGMAQFPMGDWLPASSGACWECSTSDPIGTYEVEHARRSGGSSGAGTTGARIGGAIGELGCEMARCAIHEEPAG